MVNRHIILNYDLTFIKQSLDRLVAGFIKENAHLTLSPSFFDIDTKAFFYSASISCFFTFLKIVLIDVF